MLRRTFLKAVIAATSTAAIAKFIPLQAAEPVLMGYAYVVGCGLAKGKMKRFMLFAGQSFYANGGFLDFVDSFDSAQEAVDYAASKYDPPDGMFADEWWHVVDIETQQIVAKQEGDYCGRQQ